MASTSRVDALLAAFPAPKRDVEPGQEIEITDVEVTWAREKMSGENHSDSGFSTMHVAGCVRMLMRDDLHHERICTMGRDRIARLVLEVDRLRNALAERQSVEAAVGEEREACAGLAETVYKWSPAWDGKPVHKAIANAIRTKGNAP